MTSFGHLPDGREAALYSLVNARGFRADITNYGGIVVRLVAPDRDGRWEDVALGYNSVEEYVRASPFFGAPPLSLVTTTLVDKPLATPVAVSTQRVSVETANGVFAGDGLDKATAVLLREVPPPTGNPRSRAACTTPAMLIGARPGLRYTACRLASSSSEASMAPCTKRAARSFSGVVSRGSASPGGMIDPPKPCSQAACRKKSPAPSPPATETRRAQTPSPAG